ncbi:PspC domain-containing protein [Paenibacillus sp. TRM 82003]|uniref:PspC domain-containing protein n=1 Tax=Kineococcus sp. TRM81007 TaxID=2925831 RepID=UPI001F571482|nr:PspC domain-containing protein [Kineococcus sp. TRM81007]MCI2237970.1 PspC domain-containing protein [Kineococcus sp. TRM81007]MCI3925985.1 PspC domain-containing protein [Paenibacillus sp. TRM 82003]
MTNTDANTDPTGTSRELPPAGPRPGPDRFFDGVRRTGLTRGHDRWVAGVCGGVAHRLGVNPAAVRVGVVVLALLGGLGVLLYGLAWAVLPDATGRIEAQAAHRGDVSASFVAAVGLVVLDLIGGVGLGLPWNWG